MKKNTSSSENKNSSTSQSSDSSTTTTDINNLYRQLEVLNVVIDTLFVLILGIVLNIYRVYRNKLQILDQINNTNLSENLVDIKDLPKITFAIFLYTSATFVEINYGQYMNTINTNNSKENYRAIRKAYTSFFASLIIFIGTIIGGSNNLET